MRGKREDRRHERRENRREGGGTSAPSSPLPFRSFFTLFLPGTVRRSRPAGGGAVRCQTADDSGVATGSMLMSTVTMVITGLSMGITILVGERIGR